MSTETLLRLMVKDLQQQVEALNLRILGQQQVIESHRTRRPGRRTS